MSIRTAAAAAALAFCLTTAAGEVPELYRIGRQGDADRETLLASGVPVVLETATSLLAEGGRHTADALRAEGWEVSLLDTPAEGWDYWMVGLRADSDLEALRAAGTVVHHEGDWLLLRLPRGARMASIERARVFVAPVPHSPLVPARRLPLREGPAGRGTAAAALAVPLVQKAVAAVQPTQVDAAWEHLAPPAGTPVPTRYTTVAGCGDDATWVRDTLAGYGLATTTQAYRTGYAPNVLATHGGATTPSRVYLVEGHLDDMPSSGYAPGADDNASGSVVVLESARVLSCWAFRSTLKFLCVTGEETGLEGSSAYAADAASRGEDLRAVLNMDMVGWEGNDNPPGENLDLNYDAASQALGLFYAQCATDYATGIAVDAFLCPSLTASDHYPFWQQGYAAVCGITDNEGYCGHGGSYPYYHQSSDTLANCGDRNFFYGVVRTTVAALAEMAQPFKIAFGDDAYTCLGPAHLVLGDRDLNTDPAAVESVTVEVWSTLEPTPEWVTLTEESADSMLFRGSIPFLLGSPVHGDGQVSVGSGSTVSARYVDALDCDGAADVAYEASVLVDGECGPELTFDAAGPFAEVSGDSDGAVEAGEQWSVTVAVRNTGNTGATAARAVLTASGAAVCGGPLSFGAVAPGAVASAQALLVVSPSFSPCGGALVFDLAQKRCAERAPAGDSEPGAFSVPVGHETGFPPVALHLGPSTADAFVNQAAPSTPAGSGTTMEVRDRLNQNRRALIAFDLSAIPAGSTVTAATLSLYASSAPTTSKVIEVHRLSGSWSETGVTWDTLPAFGATDASLPGGTAVGWKSWDVTGAVAAWVSGASPNHGFLLKGAQETTPMAQTYAFVTRENADATRRPLLDITYVPPSLWDCPYVGEALCAATVPGETAPGTTLSSAQTWADGTLHAWPINDEATGYRLFRGEAADLPALRTSGQDACLYWSGTATQCALPETPPAGAFYWYLVVGTNGSGEGLAGDATAGPRDLDSKGPCS